MDRWRGQKGDQRKGKQVDMKARKEKRRVARRVERLGFWESRDQAFGRLGG